jgi:hypothetical protein
VSYRDKFVTLTPQTPEASTVPKPFGKPGGPGLWKHKDLQLPPYIQHVAHALVASGHPESEAIHMAVGIVKNWAAGHDGGGHHVHGDVRAAAAANVAKWEETRGKAHAETAAHKAGKSDHALAASEASALDRILALTTVYQASFLPKGSAPGAKTLTGQTLVHAPSQTVSPSPPLPPDVAMPSPEELLALSAEIRGAGDDPVLTGAANQVRTAAQQIGNNQHTDALKMLRGAQAGVWSAHRNFNAATLPVANVFSASLDPAAAAAARAEMDKGLAQRNKYRAVSSQIAHHVDRIRRAHFHGMYNGLAEARFSSVIELAAGDIKPGATMIYLQVPPSLLPAPPDGQDKPGHITVVYLGSGIGDAQYLEACERAKAAAGSMPPIMGSLGGLGVFPPSLSSDGARVAYVPVEAEGLHHLRGLLEDLSASVHPFRPHITLAYLQPDEDLPPPVTSARVCFSQLFVSRGDQVTAYAFTGHHRPLHTAGVRPAVTGSTALSRVLGRLP